jgi:hypothetical protein
VGLQSRWSWRRTGAVATSLTLALGPVAVVASPAAAANEAGGEACVVRPDAHTGTPARAGAAHKTDPNELTAAQVAQRERDFAEALKARRSPAIAADITIPVIFHVIRRNTSRSGGNIPTSMLNAQIGVLNDSFSGGTGGAATPFRFRLAGIRRVTNPSWYPIVYGSSTEVDMKAQLHEGGTDTLNIYTGALSDQLYGWATFPTGSVDSFDGVVMDGETPPGGRRDGGLNATGDTATHEVGHWLNLYHTFQDGCSSLGDRVADTAAESSPAFGCPTGRDTCPAAGVDPITNFMDYSEDPCMFQFTRGQATRMVNAWNALRAP